MKILHLITSLEIGGAQVMLLNLLRLAPAAGIRARVISLVEPGLVGTQIRHMDIPLTSLDMRPGVPSLPALARLVKDLRRDPPDLIQTWMYHSDLLGGLAGALAGGIPVVWGLHHTLGGSLPVRPATLAVVRLNAILSHYLPRRIICCAHSTLLAHAQRGFSARRMLVIPNGIDLDQFQPDPLAPASLRHELGLPIATPLIGLFARFHPQKDHHTFLRAAALLHARLPAAHFILAGEEMTPANPQLRAWLDETRLHAQVHLLGLRTDMPLLMAALDLYTLSSAYGEALPLSVAEAMACGVPCVVTAIGDSAAMVGPTGRAVPPSDPTALAEAWHAILSLPPALRLRLGVLTRQRVHERYNILTVAAQYHSLHASILSHP